jgi:hypothetical protein
MLLECFNETELPKSFFPAMLPWAWTQDPEMPEQRRVFPCSVNEIHLIVGSDGGVPLEGNKTNTNTPLCETRRRSVGDPVLCH